MTAAPRWVGRRCAGIICGLPANPLLLRIAGLAYCRRRWGRVVGRPWFRRRRGASYAIPAAVFALISCVVPPVLLVTVPLTLAALAAAITSSVAWREEAREGRLTDIYLAFSTEEIVDASRDTNMNING